MGAELPFLRRKSELLIPPDMSIGGADAEAVVVIVDIVIK